MEYTSIASSLWTLHKDKGSKFWACAYHVFTQEDMKMYLDEAKETYPDATHWCYAAIYDYPKDEQMSQDNGEPNGTAGLPILRRIQSSGLLNCLVIVVRYYGGTKLGTRGLIEAYGAAAELAINESRTKTYVLTQDFILRTAIAQENNLHIMAKRLNAQVISQDYTAKDVSLTIRIPQAQINEMLPLQEEFYLVNVAELA
jgi:uncharacterized YigZ family protein